MNVKNLSLLIAIGFVIGLLVGFPVAKVIQGVKTVTKKTTVTAKIENGISTQRLIASLGTPADVLSAPLQVTLPKGCATYVGKNDPSTGQPEWIVVACAFGR